MIIGVTGTLGAGKGTISQLLIERGLRHYSVRDFISKEIEKRGLVVNRDNLVYVGNDLREKNSSSYIVEQVYELAKKDGGNCVIESFRTQGEIDALRKKDDFFLIAIDGNPGIRYSRISERASETDRISFEVFLANEQREIFSYDPNKQNLSKCISMADFKILNNGTIDELKQNVEIILQDIERKTKKAPVSKRSEYLSWDDYFMGVSILSAKRSKDPSTQVGACIVNEDKKIIGIGYNGFPKGCSDEVFPWAREGGFLETKYAYVVHAELNAILNSLGRDLRNCTMYVALFPCNECTKAIIQSGIKRVVYLSDKYADSDSVKASKKMLDAAGVRYDRIIPKEKEIILKFEV